MDEETRQRGDRRIQACSLHSCEPHERLLAQAPVPLVRPVQPALSRQRDARPRRDDPHRAASRRRALSYGPLRVAAIAEVYAVALIGGAALLMRIGQRRPAVMLALLTALYQCSLTLHGDLRGDSAGRRARGGGRLRALRTSKRSSRWAGHEGSPLPRRVRDRHARRRHARDRPLRRGAGELRDRGGAFVALAVFGLGLLFPKAARSRASSISTRGHTVLRRRSRRSICPAFSSRSMPPLLGLESQRPRARRSSRSPCSSSRGAMQAGARVVRSSSSRSVSSASCTSALTSSSRCFRRGHPSPASRVWPVLDDGRAHAARSARPLPHGQRGGPGPARRPPLQYVQLPLSTAAKLRHPDKRARRALPPRALDRGLAKAARGRRTNIAVDVVTLILAIALSVHLKRWTMIAVPTLGGPTPSSSRVSSRPAHHARLGRLCAGAGLRAPPRRPRHELSPAGSRRRSHDAELDQPRESLTGPRSLTCRFWSRALRDGACRRWRAGTRASRRRLDPRVALGPRDTPSGRGEHLERRRPIRGARRLRHEHERRVARGRRASSGVRQRHDEPRQASTAAARRTLHRRDEALRARRRAIAARTWSTAILPARAAGRGAPIVIAAPREAPGRTARRSAPRGAAGDAGSFIVRDSGEALRHRRERGALEELVRAPRRGATYDLSRRRRGGRTR